MKKICLMVCIFISSLTCDAFGLTAPNVSVTEETNTSISLTWVDKSTDENGFGVQLKTKSGYDPVINLPPNTTTFKVLGLTPNSSFTYRVVAYVTSPLQLEPSNDVSGHTTHTWSGGLLTCLGQSGAVSSPPTRAELLTITSFDCSQNDLFEVDPVSDLENLTTLDLHDNFIAGSFPSWICGLTDLIYLDLGTNELTDSIPADIGNLANLQTLRLTWNKLTGPIPIEIGNLLNLQELYLSGFWGKNQLTGSIPAEIGNLTSLKILTLGNNQLTGSIPHEIGKLTSLQELYLSGNNLTGFIPQEIGELSSLLILKLNDNLLTGPITSRINNLTSLQLLYLSSNQLCGEIPTSLMDLTNLYDGQGISLSNNFLYTSSSSLDVFLVLKGGDWESSQGEMVCPSDFSWNLFLPAIIGRHQ